MRVWYARAAEVAAEPARVGRLLTWLQEDERTRYDRFPHDLDRLMFLVGRVMARALVGRATGVSPTAWRWREGPHGRPEIDDPDSSLRFNLAHSAGLVVCAIADGRDVGVDVENLQRSPSDRAIVNRYCSPAEIADVDAQAPSHWYGRFLVYWTLKEAYLKARGLGLSVHLADVSFALGPEGARVGFLGSLEATDTRWIFHLERPTQQHLVAVAASCADGVRPAITVDPLPMEILG